MRCARRTSEATQLLWDPVDECVVEGLGVGHGALATPGRDPELEFRAIAREECLAQSTDGEPGIGWVAGESGED